MPTRFSADIGRTRQELARKLKIHGYSACVEALYLLNDHYTASLASKRYQSIEDYISKLHHTITFDTDDGTSIISPDLAFKVVQKLCNEHAKQGNSQADNFKQHSFNDGPVSELAETENNAETIDNEQQQRQQLPASDSLTVRVKNVEYAVSQQQVAMGSKNTKIAAHSTSTTTTTTSCTNNSSTSISSSSTNTATIDFEIHYNFLLKRLASLPVFKEHFQLTNLATLTGSRQPSIRCVCFGLLVKDITKIDGYMLIDSTGRVPVRLTPETTYRNRLAYLNCIVLVEGVYVNPDDVLFAANIGLPPVLLDPIKDKSLACLDEKMIIILKEIYLDDEDICQAVDLLFTGYNSLEEPPLIFILIGDFTRHPCTTEDFRIHMKKLLRSIRACDNLKQSHFVFVPSQRDSACQFFTGATRDDESNTEQLVNKIMPKAPLTDKQLPKNLLTMHGFDNVHLATNPAHIYIDDRVISVVSHSYIKELRKHLLHDLSDRNDELFQTARQIMLANGHLSAGISRTYTSPMQLWHKPDLLVLADTDAFGNRYDFSLSKSDDTSFMTLPSFSRQSNQFKVYYLKSGDIDDSEVTLDAVRQLEMDDEGGDDVIETE